jgi:tetratricopeptide (TPR) repeat protein
MKRVLSHLSSVLLLLTLSVAVVAQRNSPGAKTEAQAGKSKPKATPAGKSKPKATTPGAAAGDDALKTELEEVLKLAPAERIERLQAFVKANPNSPSLPRAQELLTSARAALGDEKLRTGDRAGGAELFRAAVAEAPSVMSDKLFVEVVSQLPANLYLLGEREAALALAREVEARAKDNARRLLLVASFYLGVEQPEEAARVAAAAVALQPDLAPAHQALGTAYRYELRLDDAATEFARALELDPKSASSRRTLAELRRATGKPEEALALYREQLAADAQDAGARTGLVLSLFDAGKREEAERELQSSLAGESANLPLLVGASYWYAAHGEGARALELAERAVALEPRYGWAWARIAQGRALLALKRPLEAERALRAARRFGNFPTLDYELASALAAAGLYEEAGEQLARSFAIRDGQVETRLAGRVEAHAADFTELLAPERRASLSQFNAASLPGEARMLKALLAFYLSTKAGDFDEKAATDAAREFAAGDDAMRAYRNLYVASRLEQRGAAQGVTFESAEAAIGGVEAALDVPYAPVALFADTDELRQLRQQVVETDTPLNMLNVQRDVLSKVMRGRIEALAGWALYNQGQTAEAAVRLRRAVSVLPENTVWWRSAEWRLGAALEAGGGTRDALAAYVNSYRAQPEPMRRTVIEALYKRLNNGSLKGLDALLATPAATASAPPASAQAATPSPSAETPSAQSTGGAINDTKAAAPETGTAPATVEPTTTTPVMVATPTAPPSNISTPTPSPETATPTATPEQTPTTPAQTATPEPTPVPSSERKPEQSTGGAGGVCALTVNEPSITIKSNGGSATITIGVENYTGTSAPRINSSTTNWADVIVFPEPRVPSDGNGARFTITSTSRNTGTFNVIFASSCGKQQVAVNVQ